MLDAVVLAAGRGTRLRPLTDTVPKAMVDIGGRPLLYRIVAELLSLNTTRIIFVVGHLAEYISENLGDGKNFEATFIYERQGTLNGTGGALKLAQPHLQGDFLLIFGDSFFGPKSIATVATSTWKNAVGVVDALDPSRYGVVETTDDGRILSIEEKPHRPRSNKIVAGIYKFSSQIWSQLDQLVPSARGELELPEAVRGLISEGNAVGAVPLPLMIDVGTPADLARVREIVRLEE